MVRLSWRWCNFKPPNAFLPLYTLSLVEWWLSRRFKPNSFQDFMQARYAHLCTIMSRMHHRRRGYPFGSLVDFATDASGRKHLFLNSWPFWGKLVVWVCSGWQRFNILFCEYAQIPYFHYHHWQSTLETFWQIRDALWWFRYAPFTFSFAYFLLIADSGRSIWLILSSIHLWVLLGFWHFQQIGVWILSCLELLDKASLIFICGCPPPGIEILNLLVEGGELTFVVKTQLTNWFWGKWQIPGWSGLANARVTIFGDVYPLPEDQQVATRSSSSNWIVRRFVDIIVQMMMSSLNCTFLLWHSQSSFFAGPCT